MSDREDSGSEKRSTPSVAGSRVGGLFSSLSFAIKKTEDAGRTSTIDSTASQNSNDTDGRQQTTKTSVGSLFEILHPGGNDDTAAREDSSKASALAAASGPISIESPASALKGMTYKEIMQVTKSVLSTYGKHLIGGVISFADWRGILSGLGVVHTELRARIWFDAARVISPPTGLPPPGGFKEQYLEPDGLTPALYIVSRVAHLEYISLRDAFVYFRLEGTSEVMPLSKALKPLLARLKEAQKAGPTALALSTDVVLDKSALASSTGPSSVVTGATKPSDLQQRANTDTTAATDTTLGLSGIVTHHTPGLVDGPALHALLNAVGVRVTTEKVNDLLKLREKVPGGVYVPPQELLESLPANQRLGKGDSAAAGNSVSTGEPNIAEKVFTFLSTYFQKRKPDPLEPPVNTELKLDYEMCKDVFLQLCDVKAEIAKRKKYQKKSKFGGLKSAGRSQRSVLKHVMTYEDESTDKEIKEACAEALKKKGEAPPIRAGLTSTIMSPLALNAVSAFNRGELLQPASKALEDLRNGKTPGKAKSMAMALADRDARKMLQVRQRELDALAIQHENALKRQMKARDELAAEANKAKSAANNNAAAGSRSGSPSGIGKNAITDAANSGSGGAADDAEGLDKVRDTLLQAVAQKKEEDGEFLNYSGQNLSALPSRPWQLGHAGSNPLIVDASYNCLEALPEANKLTAVLGTEVIKLDISHNRLSALPDTISQLSKLQILMCNSNNLVHIPDSICTLEHLQLLYLSANQLNRLPFAFGELSAIRVLHLDGNCLKELPLSLGGMTSLEDLDVSNNRLVTLPAGISSCVKLRQLRCPHNHIVELPGDLGKCEELRLLDCSYNRMRELPGTLGNCKQLRVINGSNNQIRYLPSSFTGLRNLLDLDVSHNEIKGVDPAVFIKARSLQRLNLGFNKLERLPPTVGHCVLLQELIVSNNVLTEIPAEIAACKYLSRLLARANRLGSLADEDRIARVGAKVNVKAKIKKPAQYMSIKEMLLEKKDEEERKDAEEELLKGMEDSESSSSDSEGEDNGGGGGHHGGGRDSVDGSSNSGSGTGSGGYNYGSLTAGGKRRVGLILPPTVGVMPSLEWVDVSYNEAIVLTPELGLCPKLMHLNASHNRIRKLEPQLCKSATLRSLMVNNNMIKSISNVVGNFMMTLEALDVSANELERLPDSLGHCANLRHLLSSGNRLLNVPASFGRLMHVIITLDVERNPLLELPAVLPWLGDAHSSSATHPNPDGARGDFVEESFMELKHAFPHDYLTKESRVRLQKKRDAAAAGSTDGGSTDGGGASTHLSTVAESVAFPNAVKAASNTNNPFPETHSDTLGTLLQRYGARLAADSNVISLNDYCNYARGMLPIIEGAIQRVPRSRPSSRANSRNGSRGNSRAGSRSPTKRVGAGASASGGGDSKTEEEGEDASAKSLGVTFAEGVTGGSVVDGNDNGGFDAPAGLRGYEGRRSTSPRSVGSRGGGDEDGNGDGEGEGEGEGGGSRTKRRPMTAELDPRLGTILVQKRVADRMMERAEEDRRRAAEGLPPERLTSPLSMAEVEQGVVYPPQSRSITGGDQGYKHSDRRPGFQSRDRSPRGSGSNHHHPSRSGSPRAGSPRADGARATAAATAAAAAGGGFSTPAIDMAALHSADQTPAPDSLATPAEFAPTSGAYHPHHDDATAREDAGGAELREGGEGGEADVFMDYESAFDQPLKVPGFEHEAGRPPAGKRPMHESEAAHASYPSVVVKGMVSDGPDVNRERVEGVRSLLAGVREEKREKEGLDGDSSLLTASIYHDLVLQKSGSRPPTEGGARPRITHQALPAGAVQPVSPPRGGGGGGGGGNSRSGSPRTVGGPQGGEGSISSSKPNSRSASPRPGQFANSFNNTLGGNLPPAQGPEELSIPDPYQFHSSIGLAALNAPKFISAPTGKGIVRSGRPEEPPTYEGSFMPDRDTVVIPKVTSPEKAQEIYARRYKDLPAGVDMAKSRSPNPLGGRAVNAAHLGFSTPAVSPGAGGGGLNAGMSIVSAASDGGDSAYVPLHGLARSHNNTLMQPSLLSVDSSSSGGSVSLGSSFSLPPSEVTLARWNKAMKLSESFTRERQLAWQLQDRAEDVLMKLARLAPSMDTLADALRSTSVLRLLVRARVDAALDTVETAEEAAAREAAAKITTSRVDAAGSAWRADAFDEFAELQRVQKEGERLERTRARMGIRGPMAGGNNEAGSDALVPHRHFNREHHGITDASVEALERTDNPAQLTMGLAISRGLPRGVMRDKGVATWGRRHLPGDRVEDEGPGMDTLHHHDDKGFRDPVMGWQPRDLDPLASTDAIRSIDQGPNPYPGKTAGWGPDPRVTMAMLHEREPTAAFEQGPVLGRSQALIPRGVSASSFAGGGGGGGGGEGGPWDMNSREARQDIITDMLHGLVGGPQTTQSRAGLMSLRYGNTAFDAHPARRGKSGAAGRLLTNGGGSMVMGPQDSFASSIGMLSHLPSGSSVHAKRVTVSDLKKQLLHAKKSGGMTGRTARQYSNADVAQYAVLVSIFVPYADEEWTHRGGLYLLGKATSHEFVAAVIHRLIADYYFGIRANALPMMIADTSARLTERPSKLESISSGGSENFDPLFASASGDAMTSVGSNSHAGAFFAKPSAHAAAKLGFGRAGSVGSRSNASGIGAPISAFDSLPALLGDEWNEALLRCIYHYYVRAHTRGCVPLFGELSPEEAKWRKSQAATVKTFRNACKRLAYAAREHAAWTAVERSKAFALGTLEGDRNALNQAAEDARRRMQTERDRLDAIKNKAARMEAVKLRGIVARKQLQQTARVVERQRVEKEKFDAEAAALKELAKKGVRDAILREKEEAFQAGFNPDMYQAHVKRALYAAGLAAMQ